ncbi:MAG TPA: TIR domain-containing protein [Cyclobacteriaceae bacterium]|nr:TIR domain-containing protein [Cyclobacteriaceae bacterium]
MAYDIDVLITFSDKDNEIGKKAEEGWVNQFRKFLDLMLYQVLGEKTNIVLKSEFEDYTASSLDNAAVLVTILSKDFAQSGRCLDTVEAYYKATSSSKVNRVFKVLKSPLTNQEQPPRLRELLGYDMFQIDNETGLMKEYTDFFSLEAEKQYWMKMIDLVYDIHDTLTILKGQAKAEVKNLFKRRTIYLAETGHDLSIQRNIIRRELQRHGYVVLPGHVLPNRLEELEREVRKELEECSLSIHLIGSAYGEIPEGSDRSVVDVQNKLAAEHAVIKRSRKEDFSRLIWIAPNLRNASDKQKGFIDSLRRDIEAQEGAEILQNPLEDFKNIMREELLAAQNKTAEVSTNGKTIYLVHDKVDHDQVLPLVDIIQKSGFNVVFPAFEGDLMDVRKRHIDNLRNFDAAIIYKGKVNDQWVRMKVLDLLKAPGFGRNKPIQGKAIVSETSLDSYKNQNVTLISGDKNKSVESIKMFLQEFKS